MSSMLNSTRVTSQIDDDFLRRLVSAIEDTCNEWSAEVGKHDSTEANVEACLDGDQFLAYQRAKELFKEAYPDLYPEDED